MPELIFSSESESEVKQPAFKQSVEPLPVNTSSPPVKPSFPEIEPDFMRRLGEALVQRRGEMALENSPAIGTLTAEIEKTAATVNALSAATEGMAETIEKLLVKRAKAEVSIDEKQRQTQTQEGQAVAPLVEEKQEPVKRHEQPRQRQKKQAKRRDQGMEM